MRKNWLFPSKSFDDTSFDMHTNIPFKKKWGQYNNNNALISSDHRAMYIRGEKLDSYKEISTLKKNKFILHRGEKSLYFRIILLYSILGDFCSSWFSLKDSKNKQRRGSLNLELFTYYMCDFFVVGFCFRPYSVLFVAWICLYWAGFKKIRILTEIWRMISHSSFLCSQLSRYGSNVF